MVDASTTIMIVIGSFSFFGLMYWLAEYITAREINKRYDDAITKKPDLSDFYNMLRYVELKDEKKAQEYFHKDLKDRTSNLIKISEKINEI